MKRNQWLWLLFSLVLYCISLLVGAVFSFSFTDPNLVLSTNAHYWQGQQWLWHTWFDHPAFQAQSYAAIITAQWLLFAVFVWQLHKKQRSLTGLMAGILLVCVIASALISYNWLSHDVFNYIFNARIVVVYHANPHVKVALNFVGDPWIRFMHNTHTSAPYGYGWTGLSVLPYILGGGKFLPTWLQFRLMAITSLIGTGVLLWYWLKTSGMQNRQWLVVALGCSPLVLSEVVMNAHNDLWMLLPAVGSIYLLDRWRVQRGLWRVVLASALLIFSISIKWATVVLLPLVGLLLLTPWCRGKWQFVNRLQTSDVALIASLLLFIPLLTARSQYFHPWYLLWSLVWLPLIKRDWWSALLMGFAVSSTYRYLPWISAGGFEGDVLYQQQLVTWIGGLILGMCFWLLLRFRSRSV